MQGNPASSRREWKVSWVFWICGRNLGYILGTQNTDTTAPRCPPEDGGPEGACPRLGLSRTPRLPAWQPRTLAALHSREDQTGPEPTGPSAEGLQGGVSWLWGSQYETRPGNTCSRPWDHPMTGEGTGDPGPFRLPSRWRSKSSRTKVPRAGWCLNLS